MQFLSNPFLMTGNDIQLPFEDLSGTCYVQLGCCCQQLTGS